MSNSLNKSEATSLGSGSLTWISLFAKTLILAGFACLSIGCDSTGPQTKTSVDHLKTESVGGDDKVGEHFQAAAGSEELEEFKPTQLQPITTAEELLSRLAIDPTAENGLQARIFRVIKLPTQETTKVARALRAKYPLESIRERLAFQAKHPTPPQIDRAPVVFARHGERRAQALEILHSEEVDWFINRSGQGIFRSLPLGPDDLRSDENYAKSLNTIPIDSKLVDGPIVQLPDMKAFPDSFGGPKQVVEYYAVSKSGLPRQELVDAFQAETALKFSMANSLGFVKSVDEVAGFEAHKVRFSNDWSEDLRISPASRLAEQNPEISGLEISWKVNQLQLVSLLMHDAPSVYVSENLPNMEELSNADIKTRGLNAFEADGLERLMSGEDVVTAATQNRIVMLGAIRASGKCLECHSANENQLLGAFSYEFLRSPKSKEPATANASGF